MDRCASAARPTCRRRRRRRRGEAEGAAAQEPRNGCAAAAAGGLSSTWDGRRRRRRAAQLALKWPAVAVVVPKEDKCANLYVGYGLRSRCPSAGGAAAASDADELKEQADTPLADENVAHGALEERRTRPREEAPAAVEWCGENTAAGNTACPQPQTADPASRPLQNLAAAPPLRPPRAQIAP